MSLIQTGQQVISVVRFVIKIYFIRGGISLDNTMKYCIQVAYLNQLMNRNLVSEKEYIKIKNYLNEKYNMM